MNRISELTSPTPTPQPSDPIANAFLGATVALIVARPLIGDVDPARLRLTTGAGPLTHQLLTLLLVFAWGCWRLRVRQPIQFGGSLVGVMLLVLGVMIASTLLVSPYTHASWRLIWEMISLTGLVWLVRQWRNTPGASVALLTVLLALGASVASQAVYQSLREPLEWPDLELPKVERSAILVGDLTGEYPVTQLPPSQGVTRGCFDGSATLLVFLLPLLPLMLYVGHVGWWKQKTPRSRGRILLVLFFLGAVVFGVGYLLQTTLGASVVKAARWGGSIGDALGLGPGTFSRIAGFPHPTSGSALLDLRETLGLVGLATILLGGLFILVKMAMNASRANVVLTDHPEFRNVLLSGGVAGSLLGFILSTGNIPAEAPPNVVLNLGVVAGVRSLVFFASLALLQNLALRSSGVIRTISAGMGIMLLAFYFLPQAQYPVVLAPFLVLVALALNLQEGPSVRLFRLWQPAMISFTGFLLVALQLMHSLQPGVATTSAVRDARAASRLLADLIRDVDVASGARKLQAMQKMESFLRNQIVYPLRSACRSDSGNSILLTETALWLRLEWNYCLRLGDTKRAAEVTREMLFLHEESVKHDPQNPDALDQQLETLLYVFDESKTLRKERAALIEKNLAQNDFVAREKYLQVLLRVHERPVVKPVEEERKFIRDLLESEAIKLFKEDASARQNGTEGLFKEKQRENWISRLTISLLDPNPELKEFLKSE